MPDPTSQFGTISIGGQQIPRAAAPPIPPNAAQAEALKLGIWGLDFVPPGMGLKNWRSASSAKEAVSTPTGGGSLGHLVILRPGASNFCPSAAYIFRAAMYADFVVMAYQNTFDPSMNHLRKMDQHDGVAVPDEVAGKVFCIGSPDPGVMSIEQVSDSFLSQLATMSAEQDVLGFDPLTAGATIIGHSQGCADIALTRKRLNDAGLGAAVGKLVTLGSGLGIAQLPASATDGGIALQRAYDLTTEPLLKVLGDGTEAETQNDLVGQYRRLFPPGTESLVALSIAGCVGGPAQLGVKLVIIPIKVVDPNNIKLGIRAFLLGMPLLTKDDTHHEYANMLEGNSNDTDGLVPNAVSQCAQKYVLLDQPHDHTGLVEDPMVIDAIVANLG